MTFVEGAPSWRQHRMDMAGVQAPDGMTVDAIVDEYCQRCGDEVDALTVGHTEYDSDLYLYQCDGCGDSGVMQPDHAYADGPVYARAAITDQDDFFREIRINSGARVMVRDQSAEYEEDGVLFEKEYDADKITRPDGLIHNLLRRHEIVLPQELRETLEQQLESPDFVVELYDQTGASSIEDPQVELVWQGRIDDPVL